MKPVNIGGRLLEWGRRTYLMGIVNMTPDSFSGDGLSTSGEAQALQSALEQSRRFVAAGADILDIGGESTRPGAQAVDAATERERVVPLVRRLAEEGDALVSIDTYKASVAEAALQAGAQIVNDVWALRGDPDLAQVASHYQAALILMHNRSSWAPPEIRQRLGAAVIAAPYQDLLADVCRELMESVALAHAAGIPDDHILLDPGIGFGKTPAQNLELIDRLGEIRALGFPVLLGPSRKSFIGAVLNLPVEERLEGTAAAVAVGIARGADIVRVHDVPAMARVVRLADAIVRR